ncbi:MAG: hypothetical protein JSS11_00110 [Verrucomicrobia bacterium]|nr:hypothetical protein [Verrucomicrobiota bacterium]
MNPSTTWPHRAVELMHELWDAILEEEAILEESGWEPGEGEPGLEDTSSSGPSLG